MEIPSCVAGNRCILRLHFWNLVPLLLCPLGNMCVPLNFCSLVLMAEGGLLEAYIWSKKSFQPQRKKNSAELEGFGSTLFFNSSRCDQGT